MTEMTVSRSGDRFDINISGHAGSGAYGSDIVCAAVSSHFYTLAQAMTDHNAEIHTLDVSEAEGKAELSVTAPTPEQQAIITAVCRGLKLLSLFYPNNLAVDMGEDEGALPGLQIL